ncbi:MAG: glutamate synthase subunit alpha, partial [Candidatus Omnitrophica bacterium]|nr:glutamate synthase subunit alpha [Candidatus Omnitrophota bacterium]
MKRMRKPVKQGLYDPAFEHDSCGVGFVCNVDGKKNHKIIDNAVNVLEHMSHRGAVGADPRTGDGAGILIQIPHDFYRRVCASMDIDLPPGGDYGTGIIFLPTDNDDRSFCQKALEEQIRASGQELLGWRDVPVDDSILGEGARGTQPVVRQIFIGRSDSTEKGLPFERKLYVIRKAVENTVLSSSLGQKDFFYITNISSRTISYKGLLMPEQVRPYYPDLSEKEVVSGLALVHSRYSTNTFPTWD